MYNTVETVKMTDMQLTKYLKISLALSQFYKVVLLPLLILTVYRRSVISDLQTFL